MGEEGEKEEPIGRGKHDREKREKTGWRMKRNEDIRKGVKTGNKGVYEK